MTSASASVAAVFLLAFVACSSSNPPPLVASDYDQRCTASSDCVVIGVGDVCGCGGCEVGAINKVDLAKYQADGTTRHDACPNGGATNCPAGGACPASTAVCSAGTCTICVDSNCGSSDAGSDGASDATRD